MKDPSVRLEKQRRQGIEGREGHDRRRAIGEMEGEGPQREESHGGHGEEGSMEGGGEGHGRHERERGYEGKGYGERRVMEGALWGRSVIRKEHRSWKG